MSVPNPRIRFTYDDYQTLPEGCGKRYELLHGELLMAPAPTVLHQIVSANLNHELQSHVRRHALGLVLTAPIDVIFGQGDDREIVQPDILFISEARRGTISAKEIQGAPDLVVEILSPGSEERDRGYKKTLYERYGVGEYWIVDPEARQLDRYRLEETAGLTLVEHLDANDTLRSECLPGLAVALDEVF